MVENYLFSIVEPYVLSFPLKPELKIFEILSIYCSEENDDFCSYSFI